VLVTGTRAVITACSLLSVLALGACSGDDPEPRFAPPSSSAPASPSTTAASDPVPPTMPAEVNRTDAAAAEAFVRFYFEAVNYAQGSGDVSGLGPLAVKCRGCDAGVRSVTETYDDGGVIRGGRGHVVQFKTGFLDRDPNDWAVVECTVVTSPQVVDFPGTGRDRQYPKGSTDVRLILEPSQDAWVIRSLVIR
jgi:hypothetical protein